MGGNMLGIGNCGQYAGEFNFYHDSESAKIVLDKYAQQVRRPSYATKPTRIGNWPITCHHFSAQLASLHGKQHV